MHQSLLQTWCIYIPNLEVHSIFVDWHMEDPAVLIDMQTTVKVGHLHVVHHHCHQPYLDLVIKFP